MNKHETYLAEARKVIVRRERKDQEENNTPPKGEWELCYQVGKLALELQEADLGNKWISVDERLPDEHKYRMSKDVLTLAGSKMSVKCYDYELGRWTGSPHVTVTHWSPRNIPNPPKP